jgi:hypothetical protein
MSETTAIIVMVILFGLFEAVGGISIGMGVRDMIAGSSKNLGAVLTGALFGGMAILMSGLMLRPLNQFLFLLGVLVFLAAFGARLFVPQGVVDRIGAGTLVALGISIAALPIGGVVGVEAFRHDDPLFGILFGGCTTVVGGGFFLTGVGALLRGKPLILRTIRPGEMEIVPADEPIPAEPPTHRKKKKEGRSDGTQDSPH